MGGLTLQNQIIIRKKRPKFKAISIKASWIMKLTRNRKPKTSDYGKKQAIFKFDYLILN